MSDNRIGLILVGDELLSGRRADKHLGHMTRACEARGIDIAQVWLIGDDEELLSRVIEDARRPLPPAEGATGAGERVPVISFGGIGGTPDDRTREAASAAFGRPLELHAEALQLLEARYGKAELHDNRLNMIRFPSGVGLIPNPVNQVPGFHLDRMYFVPGFPEMAWPMAEWALDREFAQGSFEPPMTRLLRAQGARESDFIALMVKTRTDFPRVKVSSLPHMGSDGSRAHIEFGFRGPADQADAARAAFRAQASADGYELELL